MEGSECSPDLLSPSLTQTLSFFQSWGSSWDFCLPSLSSRLICWLAWPLGGQALLPSWWPGCVWLGRNRVTISVGEGNWGWEMVPPISSGGVCLEPPHLLSSFKVTTPTLLLQADPSSPPFQVSLCFNISLLPVSLYAPKMIPP